MSKQLKGSLMVLTAGIAWGFSGVSGQYLMAHGVNVNLLTSLRLLLSGILLTASVFFRQRDKLVQAIKDRKTLVSIALFALFGLVQISTPISVLFNTLMLGQRRSCSMSPQLSSWLLYVQNIVGSQQQQS